MPHWLIPIDRPNPRTWADKKDDVYQAARGQRARLVSFWSKDDKSGAWAVVGDLSDAKAGTFATQAGVSRQKMEKVKPV